VELRFLGAAGSVTGSCHLLKVGGHLLLLDCGQIQGSHLDEELNRIPLPVSDVDAVVLSHAHIDHSGRLPLLRKQGFTAVQGVGGFVNFAAEGREHLWCFASNQQHPRHVPIKRLAHIQKIILRPDAKSTILCRVLRATRRRRATLVGLMEGEGLFWVGERS